MTTTTHIDETVSYPPRYWWLKRIAISSVLLILAYIAVMKWWAYEAHRRLQAEIDAIHARGEPVLVEDFVVEPVPVEDNAALSLIAAAQQAIALPAPEQAYIDSYDRGVALDATALSKLAPIKQASTVSLALTRAARFQTKVHWGVKISSPTINVMLPALGGQRSLASLLHANAIYEHAVGHDAESIEIIRDMLRQSDLLQKQSPTLVAHLVAVAISSFATETIRQISYDLTILSASSATTSPSSTASRQQVMALIDELLDEKAYRQGIIHGLQGERTMQYDSAVTVAGRAAASRMGSSMPASRLLNPLQPMFEMDALHMMRYMSSIIAAGSAPDFSVARTSQTDNFLVRYRTDFTTLSHLTRIMSYSMMPALNRAIQNHFRSLTGRRVAALRLAIRLYQIDHDGKFPESLDMLVPRYIPSLPIDPFSEDARPVGYRVAPEPMLYSAGLDGKDSGGDSTLKNPRQTPLAPPGHPNDFSNWDRRDVIFPLTKFPPTTQPATDAD